MKSFLLILSIAFVVNSQTIDDSISFHNTIHKKHYSSPNLSFDLSTSLFSFGEGSGWVGVNHSNVHNKSLYIGINPSLFVYNSNIWRASIYYSIKRYEADNTAVVPNATPVHTVSYYNFIGIIPSYEPLFIINNTIKIGSQIGLNIRYPIKKNVSSPGIFGQIGLNCYYKKIGIINMFNFHIDNENWEDEIISYFIGIRINIIKPNAT